MLRPPPRSTLFPYTTLFRFLSGGDPSLSLAMTSKTSWHSLVTANNAIRGEGLANRRSQPGRLGMTSNRRSEEHTSELQSLRHLVCRLLLEKKKKQKAHTTTIRTDPTHRKSRRNTSTTIRTTKSPSRPITNTCLPSSLIHNYDRYSLRETDA